MHFYFCSIVYGKTPMEVHEFKLKILITRYNSFF